MRLFLSDDRLPLPLPADGGDAFGPSPPSAPPPPPVSVGDEAAAAPGGEAELDAPRILKGLERLLPLVPVRVKTDSSGEGTKRKRREAEARGPRVSRAADNRKKAVRSPRK